MIFKPDDLGIAHLVRPEHKDWLVGPVMRQRYGGSVAEINFDVVYLDLCANRLGRPRPAIYHLDCFVWMPATAETTGKLLDQGQSIWVEWIMCPPAMAHKLESWEVALGDYICLDEDMLKAYGENKFEPPWAGHTDATVVRSSMSHRIMGRAAHRRVRELLLTGGDPCSREGAKPARLLVSDTTECQSNDPSGVTGATPHVDRVASIVKPGSGLLTGNKPVSRGYQRLSKASLT